MKKLIILLMAMLIFALGSGIGSAAETTVQPGDSIQAAVNSASPGDVIIIKSGTYSENIQINKPDLVIRSESGNPDDTVITARNSNTSIFSMTANNITISGFKVNSGGYSGVTGIRLSRCSNCTITNNNLSENRIGIYLSSSNYSKISGNRANLNSLYGIYLLNSEGNKLLSNSANSNSERGINSITSNKNTILGNNVLNNNVYGMWISQSHDNNISGNTVNECGNDGAGGRISGGGIHFNSSSRNTISGNIVAFNLGSGFFECPGCHNNIVYNNYVNNVYNANIKTRDTTWNKPKTAGPNIVGGPYIGGNFWATPAGTGFSETAQDRDGDGFADTEYDVSNITDKLPLVAVSNLPVANFSMTPANGSGSAPLSVQFTDLSPNTAGVSWDFENDGRIDSTDKNPVHTYTVPGTYIVKLTVINANGIPSLKFATITVLKNILPPVAIFSTNVTNGTAPLTVQFTDLSQNAVSWNWDFENDGIVDSIDKDPVHVYETAANYIAKLTVSNENNTANENGTVNENSTASQLVTILVRAAETGGETAAEGLPVAEPSANVTSGYIPLTVLFTDLSQNITSRSWDIGNDGTIESRDASFVYEFSSRGDYPVNLTVGNENGTAFKLITICAQRKSSSGGSGGGGGAGGSPEPAKNVKAKELSQVFITSGNSVKFEFPKNATSVAYLGFDSKKTVGKTTTIVEMLKNKSILTPDAPEGEVYNYLNVWVGNAGYGSDEDNLENAVACFRVEKSWVQDKNIAQDSIVLNRYSDKKWNELPTSLSGEDNKYLYFTAETPGFSPFAITGKITAKEAGTEIKPETEDIVKNNGSTASNVEQKPANEENTSIPGKESISTPGFEIIYGVAGLLAVFLHKRK